MRWWPAWSPWLRCPGRTGEVVRRCRSWRPTEQGVSTPGVSAPGGTRAHWRRCTVKVAPGVVRCEACTRMLCEHADAHVRRMLAQEQGLSSEVLETLLTDPDFLVSAYAEASDRADSNDERRSW